MIAMPANNLRGIAHVNSEKNVRAVTIRGLSTLKPRMTLQIELFRPSDHKVARFPVRCRIDTPTELEYFKNGGVLNYVLRNLAKPAV